MPRLSMNNSKLRQLIFLLTRYIGKCAVAQRYFFDHNLANKIEKLIVGDMPRAKIIALVRTEIYSFISLRSRKGRHVINA